MREAQFLVLQICVRDKFARRSAHCPHVTISFSHLIGISSKRCKTHGKFIVLQDMRIQRDQKLNFWKRAQINICVCD